MACNKIGGESHLFLGVHPKTESSSSDTCCLVALLTRRESRGRKQSGWLVLSLALRESQDKKKSRSSNCLQHTPAGNKKMVYVFSLGATPKAAKATS